MEVEFLRILVSSLESAGIPYMVTGSVVSAIHGEPRATRDIDVVIDPEPGELEVFLEAFPLDRFYVNDAQSALARRDMFNVLDLSSGWKADLVIRKDRPFSREELARRQRFVIAGVEAWVATVEDAILSKLEWVSLSGSGRQRRDVVQMLIANVDVLDREYVDHWAGELGLTTLLSELWSEAEAAR